MNSPRGPTIDLKAAERALIEARAYVPKAAETLGVTAAELRRFMARAPSLIEIALEAAERDLDKAEQILLEGMDGKDPLKRVEAAARVLKGRFRGSR